MSRELGREICYLKPSEREYLSALQVEGASPDYVAVQRMIYRVVRLNVSAFPNRAVRTLSGRPATSFVEFVRDHREVWTSRG